MAFFHEVSGVDLVRALRMLKEKELKKAEKLKKKLKKDTNKKNRRR